MKTKDISTLESNFNKLVETLLDRKENSEFFTLRLNSERSQFTRFNNARVRQTGVVKDTWIELSFVKNQRRGLCTFPFTGNWDLDLEQVHKALEQLRLEISLLPIDPYIVLPEDIVTSREIHSGNLLADESVVPTVLHPVNELDFTGIYAGGNLIRAYADSKGQKHWFATDTFNLDYSIFSPGGQAVKGYFAGSDWNNQTYRDDIAQIRRQLEKLSHPTKDVLRGKYKTYFAPAAVAELLSMLSWGGVSEADIQQGNSCLNWLSRQEKQLSAKFHLKENFRRGLVPRFNEWGETASLELDIIEDGKLKNTLINSRSAKEYNKIGNGANGDEGMRSPEISPGNLAFADILSALDTGLYVSNLHYLNWSDRPTGKITGMTRYACFWVEKGEIIAPIENLRFDDSLYSFWGDNLIDFTDFQEFIPNVDTYENRRLGGSMVPGMLVEDFTYTL
ncbi:MAG: TldD/PmbA family protein [Cyanobacteria bacterium P01_A01_bin.84]